ncbi:chloride channel protein [Bacillus sp. ISL-18]|uniref:chloride channel protein n=1 Tax=Bacillus sp. ISL-18 TaxID=2819118 RepID=UPI001BE86630|nr:chloride channel protein [Bacillus sp. ISL-18]MBT2658452.1 chloride channel protein [Bacillus sp. ISL-18]
MSRIRLVEPVIMIVTILRWFILATITGAIVGTGTSLFLKGLYFFTDKSLHLPWWITMCLLPIGGLLNGLILYFGYRNGDKNKKDSVISAVHEQSGIMPYKTIAIKPIAAIITLASGGAAGKEGPCSHIGGTLASWFGHVIRLSPELQKRLVACGVSAGFASVFGTPIAGAIYGIEVLTIGRIRHDFIFPAVIAGVTSFEISKLWGITYDYYPIHLSEQFSNSLFIKILLIGIVCGLISWLFIEIFEMVRRFFSTIQQRFHIWPPMMPFFGGVLLSILILIIPTDYFGLSLSIMDNALSGERVSYLGWLWKIILVSITLGSGFYGGIVTPQFVIGAIVGNVLAHILGINPALGAAVGMVSVVASASNTPIAAIFMGFELFGSVTGIYVVAACITAYITIGHRSVYPDQMVAYPKSLWMRLVPGIALENEKIHVSYTLLKKIKRWQSNQKRLHVYLKRPKKL